MHPADITAALKKAGSNQSAVARSLVNRHGERLTPAAVHNVIQGRSQSAKVALRISEITGLPVAALWPAKYPTLERQQGQRSPGAAKPRRKVA